MKTNLYKTRVPVLVTMVVALLICTGMVRRCNLDSRSRIVEDYIHPHGDTIAVAIEMDPMTYNFANDTAGGFDYEIISDIARIHRLPVKLYPVSNLEEAYRGLHDNKYNVVIAKMPATAQLRIHFPLTQTVYLDRQVLVQRRGADSVLAVNSLTELRDDTVYIADGSPFRSRLENLSMEIGGTIYVKSLPGYSSEHLAIMTANGDIRQAVVGEAVARKVAADYPALDYSTPVSFNQFQVWATAPGDTVLRDSLDSWLLQYRSTPAYKELACKYLR